MDDNCDIMLMYCECKLTDSSVKSLTDLRDRLRALIIRWEDGTSRGELPPAEKFESVVGNIKVLDSQLKDYVDLSDDKKLVEDKIRIIRTLIHAKSSVSVKNSSGPSAAPPPSCAAPATTRTPAAQLNLPVFWPAYPACWFTRVEAEFALNGITDEQVQLLKARCRLPPEVASAVHHITAAPFQPGDYARLKAAILAIYVKPAQERLDELLELVVARGEHQLKPSAALLEMRQLTVGSTAEDSITFSDKVWKQLLVAAMPKAIRASVGALPAAAAALSLDELAREADKFYAVHQEQSGWNTKRPLADAAAAAGGGEGCLNITAKKGRRQW